MRKISYIVFACVLYIPSGNAEIASKQYVNEHTADAANITKGKLEYDRLPVGTVAETVAAGDDARFYAIPTTQPTVNAPEGMVLVWFN